MWDLPGPGLEPVTPALAGGFLTTAPPGKPHRLPFSWYRVPLPAVNLCFPELTKLVLKFFAWFFWCFCGRMGPWNCLLYHFHWHLADIVLPISLFVVSIILVVLCASRHRIDFIELCIAGFFFLAVPCSMWDPSSPTRDWTLTPCIRNAES